jgi:hypothetical protein
MNRRATGRSRRFSQRTSSSAFSLGTVTGITNWWVSTAGVTVDVGDVVSAWTDQIGSDLLAAAGVARPNYVANAVNGLPAIDCAAAGQLLNDLTATSHLASVSVVAVVSIGGNGNGWLRHTNGAGNTGWRFDTNSSQHQLTILPATVLTGPARAAGYHVVIYCFGASGGFGTALDTRIIEVDGVAGTLGATAVNLAQGTTAFTIGGNGSTPKVAEIGYFNGTILSAGQRAAIASGLRAKYGI